MTEDPHHYLHKAFKHHQAGRFAEAENNYLTALGIDQNNGDAHHLIGILYGQQEILDKAEPHLEKATQIQPDNPTYLSSYGNVKKEQGHIKEAEKLYKRSLEMAPQNAQTLCNLGSILHSMGQSEKALAAIKKAVLLVPEFLEAHHILGCLYRDLQNYDKAEQHFKTALDLNPDFGESKIGLSNIFKVTGRTDEAIEALEEILAKDPHSVDTLCALATLHSEQGNIEAAKTFLEKILTVAPNHALSFFLLSSIEKVIPESRFPERIESLLEKSDFDDQERQNLHSALGKAYDDLKNYETAFENYRLANECKNKELSRLDISFDPKAHSDLTNNLIATFSTTFFETHSGKGSGSQLPIFIFGMPRSGTTLVEQIFSAHPKIAGAGELMLIQNAIMALPGFLGGVPYPECMNTLNDEVVKNLSSSVIESLEKLGNGALRVCDKRPWNFFDLGLLAILFPKATYIHCRRLPLDTCLSIYFQNFKRTLPYASDLSHIGDYYREYGRLMKHWRRVLPVKIQEVIYEDLITDQEKQSRELVDACGLEWNDKCLNFQDSNRSITTSSKWQVRQPLYKSSVNRWQNYQKFLGPLEEALGKS